MAVPKRKKSKSRIRMRKASHKKKIPGTSPCPSCGEARIPHRVCPSCGTYRSRQVLTISVDE